MEEARVEEGGEQEEQDNEAVEALDEPEMDPEESGDGKDPELSNGLYFSDRMFSIEIIKTLKFLNILLLLYVTSICSRTVKYYYFCIAKNQK